MFSVLNFIGYKVPLFTVCLFSDSLEVKNYTTRCMPTKPYYTI